MPPPDTERYCLSCQEKTIWHYNRTVGHSRCTQCGGAFSTSNEVPDEVINDIAAKLMPWVVNNNTNNNNG